MNGIDLDAYEVQRDWALAEIDALNAMDGDEPDYEERMEALDIVVTSLAAVGDQIRADRSKRRAVNPFSVIDAFLPRNPTTHVGKRADARRWCER